MYYVNNNMYYVKNKMYYVESIAEHINIKMDKASLSI